MKKNIKALFSIVLCICLFFSSSQLSFAITVNEGTCGENLTWELDSKGTLTICGTGNMETLSTWAADICYWVKNIVIEDGVTSISKQAFDGFTNLQTITIPDSVTKVNIAAFYDCKALTEVELPENLTTIGSYAFYNCKSLKRVNIPERVKKIGDCTFYNCTSLLETDIPESVKTIGEYAFYNCTSLRNATIPDSVNEIGARAFEKCSSLLEIKIPEGVTRLENYTFSECVSLQKVELPETLELIGSFVFAECEALTELEIPQSVRILGPYSISVCRSLEKVTLPKGLEYLAEGLFEDDWRLKSIEIPDSVVEVGEEVFLLCSSLTEVTFPDSVTEIGGNTLAICSSLTSFKFPSGLTKVESVMLQLDGSLTSVSFPDGITEIGAHMFYSCENLKSVEIPNSVTYIAEDIFEECPLIKDIYYMGTEEEFWNIDMTSTGDDGVVSESFKKLNIHFMTGDAIEGITLSKIPDKFEVGETADVEVAVFPSTLTAENILWSSSDENIATVEDGHITAKSNGKVTITAETENGKSDSCTFTVKDDYVKTKSLSLNEEILELTVGDTFELEATSTPENSNDYSVQWASGNKSVATVKNGTVTAVKAGASVITAEKNWRNRAKCIVIVNDPYVDVESISMNVSSAELTKGETLKLSAKITPFDATDKSVSWSSSDENIATVEKGVVTAHSSGEAYITAESATGKTVTCAITVKEAPIEEEPTENETESESEKNIFYSVKLTEGNVIDGKFYAEASVTKTGDRDEKDTVIIAAYKDGVMIDFVYMKGNFKKGETVAFGGRLTGAEGATIKAFVWDNISTMKCLSNVSEK